MKRLSLLLLLCALGFATVQAQDTKEEKEWTFGGAVGLDLSQMLFVNPKFGAGEDRIGIGGNLGAYAKYKKGRMSWDNIFGLNFGVQRLGSFRLDRPFQKSVDELRLSSNWAYGITEESPFGYSLDFLFVSQLTPTYPGNVLAPSDTATAVERKPMAQFFAPATITLSPGISFKKQTDFGQFTAMLSPAALKMILVSDDHIARLGLHGNPFSKTGTREQFIEDWNVEPAGELAGGGFYAPNYIQFGAALQAGYSHKLFPFKDEKGKEKHRLLFRTTLSLYSNYLRLPQHIDVEWITNVDVFLFKGLSIALMTNLFWDYDVFVQADLDNDIRTGVNGYEDKARRVSFLQTLLIKYSFQF